MTTDHGYHIMPVIYSQIIPPNPELSRMSLKLIADVSKHCTLHKLCSEVSYFLIKITKSWRLHPAQWQFH